LLSRLICWSSKEALKPLELALVTVDLKGMLSQAVEFYAEADLWSFCSRSGLRYFHK
jgi:hypothetical protein